MLGKEDAWIFMLYLGSFLVAFFGCSDCSSSVKWELFQLATVTGFQV